MSTTVPLLTVLQTCKGGDWERVLRGVRSLLDCGRATSLAGGLVCCMAQQWPCLLHGPAHPNISGEATRVSPEQASEA